MAAKTINVSVEQYEKLTRLVTDHSDLSDVINSVLNAGIANVTYRRTKNKLTSLVNRDPEVKELVRQKLALLK